MRRIYVWFGGRKQFNGYIGTVVLLIGLLLIDDVDFWEFALGVAGMLGITAFSIAYEDRKRDVEVGNVEQVNVEAS